MKIYDKYKILQRLYIENSLGAIFSVESATKFYGVNFYLLTYEKHYVPCLSVVIDCNGVQGSVCAHFTDKGIKKLLKTNQKMQKEINNLWEEYKEEWDLAQYEIDFKVVYNEPKP